MVVKAICGVCGEYVEIVSVYLSLLLCKKDTDQLLKSNPNLKLKEKRQG